MQSPYSLIVKEIEPLFKAYIARRLRDKGFSQIRIADMLGVSQPTIHAYLSSEEYSYENISKRINEIGLDRREFELVAEEMMELLLSNKRLEALRSFLIYINSQLSSLRLCDYHRRLDPRIPSECRICAELFAVREDIEMSEALERAFQIISSIRNISILIPEVGMNIAYRRVSAKDLRDVLAFPSRIFKINDQIMKIGGPEWGSSRHLGSIILRISRERPELRAVASLRKHECIMKWLSEKKIPYRVTGPHETGSEERVIESVSRAVASDKSIRVVIDEGGIGLEPIVYVFAENPIEISLVLKEILGLCRPKSSHDKH